MLPREAVDSPSLEAFQDRLGGIQGTHSPGQQCQLFTAL